MSILERLSKIREKIKHLVRSRPSDYPALLWAILVFLGGVINAVAIKNFADWYLRVQQYVKTTFNTDLLNFPQAYPALILYGSIVFVVPLIFSFLFSRNHPEKKLVPPLYMQLISIGFLFFFVYNSVGLLFQMYFIAVLAGSAGIVQDGIVVYALGRTIMQDNILRHSLKIDANIENVRLLMTTKQFLRLRGLRIVKEQHGKSLKFKTQGRGWRRNIGFQLFMELVEGSKPHESIINIASCELQTYGVKRIAKRDDTDEGTRNRIATLKDFFERHKITATDDSANNADSLVSYVIDEIEGMATHIREMPTRKIMVIIASAISIVVGIGLLAFGRFDLGISTLALAAFLVLDGVYRE